MAAKVKISAAALLICIFLAGCSSTVQTVPAVQYKSQIAVTASEKKAGVLIDGAGDAMLKADFWINGIENPDTILMTKEQIALYNSQIEKTVDAVVDMRAYSSNISEAVLKGFISSYKIPSKAMYDSKGNLVSNSFYQRILDNRNIDSIESINPVKYGIAVRKSAIRSFPTDEAIYDSMTSGLDRFQETAAYFCEPLLILHESKDKVWSFVQMYNYRGWVKSEDIAVAKDKEQLLSFVDSKDFVVVMDNCTLSLPSEEIKLYMGNKIPILSENTSSYLINIPVRDSQGLLSFKELEIKKSSYFNKGYLEYTQANVLKQAFKLLGTEYDWGDKYNGYDCSSYIMSVYKTFGLYLPRNADQQASVPGISTVFEKNLPDDARYKLMDRLEPGSALYMPGHTMLYIGKFNGKYYLIHDFIGYSAKSEKGVDYIPVNAVAVTSTTINTSSGDAYIKALTSALQFQQ